MKTTTVNGVSALQLLALTLSLGAMPLLVGVAGCTSGSRYQQSTGEQIDDHGISSRVKSALAHDPQYKFNGVSVETFKGTVQLSGFVNTKEQKNRAGDLAKTVTPVKEVVNNITVKEQ